MCNGLGTDVFFYRHGVVRTPFYRSVVGHKKALPAMHEADAGHDSSRVGTPVIEFECCER